MSVLFYRCDPDRTAPAPPVPAHMRIRCWQPERHGFPRRPARPSNYFWWFLAESRTFANGKFAEICIDENGRLAHRLIVTPAWYRFPFMSARDLQIGDIWTAPGARRKRLAQGAIAEAHHRFGGEGISFWYVTDADNLASQALARSCGYRLVAEGQRTRPLGMPLLGQYVIEQFV